MSFRAGAIRKIRLIWSSVGNRKYHIVSRGHSVNLRVNTLLSNVLFRLEETYSNETWLRFRVRSIRKIRSIRPSVRDR